MANMVDNLKKELIKGIDKALRAQYKRTGKANINLEKENKSVFLRTETDHLCSWNRYITKVWKWDGKIMFASSHCYNCEIEDISNVNKLEELYDTIMEVVK